MTNLTAASSARFGHVGGKLAFSGTGVVHRPRHGRLEWHDCTLAWSLCRAAVVLPALILRPRCFVSCPGRAESCWAVRGCEFPSPPPPSRARSHLDRPTGRRVAVHGVGPPHAPPAPSCPIWGVQGDPPKLANHADTDWIAQRPLGGAVRRCRDAPPHCTVAATERTGPSTPTWAALWSLGCTGWSGEGGLAELSGED